MGSRLRGITSIRGVYNFMEHLRNVRPRTADRDIKLQFSLQLRSSEDGTEIVVRSKFHVSVRVPFGPWNTMLPHRSRPHAIPAPENVPPTMESKEWSEFTEDIAPTLLKFYKGELRHPVHIPEAVRAEMVQFLTQGPPPPVPPEWIVWGVPVESTGEVPAAVVTAPVATPVVRDPVHRPFLQPRRTQRRACRCGSLTHRRVTHRSCPLNPNRANTASSTTVAPTASATETADGSSSSSFPFPVGTWVAFEFDDGVYPGIIKKHYEGEDLCQVQFTDGDTADYDGDEIHYAAQLHQRDFSS